MAKVFLNTAGGCALIHPKRGSMFRDPLAVLIEKEERAQKRAPSPAIMPKTDFGRKLMAALSVKE